MGRGWLGWVALGMFAAGCGGREPPAEPPPSLVARIELVGAPTNTSTVALRGAASLGEDESVSVSCRWDFGDGAEDTGRCETDHTYALGGTHRVTLHVRDDAGVEATTTRSVTSANPPSHGVRVVVNALGQQTVGPAPLVVAFDLSGTRSVDNGAVPQSCRWDFGDSASVEDDCGATSHLFGVPGSFTVHVTVTTRDGAVGEGTLEVQALSEDGKVLHADEAFSADEAVAALTSDGSGTAWLALRRSHGSRVLSFVGGQPQVTIDEPDRFVFALTASTHHLYALATREDGGVEVLRYALDGTGRTVLSQTDVRGIRASAQDDLAMLRLASQGEALVYQAPDGTGWARGPAEGWPAHFEAWAFTPSRELMACAQVTSSFVANGRTVPAGLDVMAFTPQGDLRWVYPVGVGATCSALETSGRGTVVALLDALEGPLAFAGTTVDSPAALVVLDEAGTQRFARAVPEGFHALSVDALGTAVVATVTSQPDCAGGTVTQVFELTLSGEPVWSRRFATSGCPGGIAAPVQLAHVAHRPWLAGNVSGSVPLGGGADHQLGSPPHAANAFWMELGL